CVCTFPSNQRQRAPQSGRWPESDVRRCSGAERPTSSERYRGIIAARLDCKHRARTPRNRASARYRFIFPCLILLNEGVVCFFSVLISKLGLTGLDRPLCFFTSI